MNWGALEKDFLANTVRQYAVAAVVFAGVCSILLLVRRVVLDRIRRAAEKYEGRLHDLYVGIIDQLRGPEVPPLVAFYAGLRQLDMPPLAHRAVYSLVVVVVAYRLIRVGQLAARIATRQLIEGHDGAPNEGAIRNVNYITNAAVWLLGGLLALSNLGVHVEALITGLGISGIAVALAAQQVLSDVFAAIAIFFDRPFSTGDAIWLDKDWNGVVERVGLKTTRIRAASGEIIVVPNSQLASSKLRNFRHLQQRRVEFGFSVARDTDVDKARRVKTLVEELARKIPQTRLDSVHLADINERSLDFRVVYHVLDADFGRYMDLNEQLLLGILEGLKKEGVQAVQPALAG